jgi:hypothetical protein
MKEILEIIKNASIGLVVLVVLAYFLKIYLEKRVERLVSRKVDIEKVSLDLKKSLRDEEREELLTFRVAVEKWEYLLQTLLFDITMLSPSEVQIAPFYKEDKQLFLDVKIAVVKVSTYLRNKDLEIQLMAAINKIRNTYYPLINETMPKLIDLQATLIPLEYKLKQFEKSDMKDMSFAPTNEDRAEHLRTQTLMTQEMQRFSENLLKEYQSIAEQMYDLKEAVNQYIYRPVSTVDVNKD